MTINAECLWLSSLGTGIYLYMSYFLLLGLTVCNSENIYFHRCFLANEKFFCKVLFSTPASTINPLL